MAGTPSKTDGLCGRLRRYTGTTRTRLVNRLSWVPTGRRNTVSSSAQVLMLEPSRSERWPWPKTITQDRPNTSGSAGTTLNLRAARSESWPWPMDRPTTSESVVGSRYLEAARSESWPWTETASTINVMEVEMKRSSYISVMQDASQRGFQAPPRHEVLEFQRKTLPPTPLPMLQEWHAERSSTLSSRSPQPTLPSVRESMAIDAHGEQHLYRSEFVSPQLKWQTRNHIVSDRPSTWVSRVEKRALIDRLGREMLKKKGNLIRSRKSQG